MRGKKAPKVTQMKNTIKNNIDITTLIDMTSMNNDVTVARIVISCDKTGNKHLSTQYMTATAADMLKKSEMNQDIYHTTTIQYTTHTVDVLNDKRFGLQIIYVYTQPTHTPCVPTTPTTDTQHTHCTITTYADGNDTPLHVYVSPHNMEDKVREITKILGTGTVNTDGSVVYTLHRIRRTVVVTKGRVA